MSNSVRPVAARCDRYHEPMVCHRDFIGAGFVSYVAIKVARRRSREIHPLLWVVAALFVVCCSSCTS